MEEDETIHELLEARENVRLRHFLDNVELVYVLQCLAEANRIMKELPVRVAAAKVADAAHVVLAYVSTPALDTLTGVGLQIYKILLRRGLGSQCFISGGTLEWKLYYRI